MLLLPTWSIVHSRSWKMQIPYLARHCRVVTFDGRGNGRSDRPAGAEAYSIDEFAADALAVMDATGDRARHAGGACRAARSGGPSSPPITPSGSTAIVYIGPAVGLAPGHPERDSTPFDEALDTDEGWAKYNSHYWTRDYLGFLEFFFAKCFNEPHSTKQIEDCIGWALETTPEALADATRGIGWPRAEDFRAMCARVRCPDARDPRRPRPDPAARAGGGAGGGDRRRARDARGLRTPPQRARPGAG